jgi:menaquinone-dependent protoporphyrinogen IX oxidase
MSRVLVTYSTNSGSTAEIAADIAGELNRNGHHAEVKLMAEVTSLEAYDSVVIGAPMILGWQNTARQFLKKHQAELANKKVAYFAAAMSLTQVPGEKLPQVPLALDKNLVSVPAKAGSLSFKERFTTLGYYLKPMLQAAPAVSPLSVAFFHGKLEMFRLNWWQAAFVMVIVQATPGDYRDWDFIKSWSQSLCAVL